MLTLSLAIEGKKEVLTIPPPRAPILKISNVIGIANPNNLCFKKKRK